MITVHYFVPFLQGIKLMQNQTNRKTQLSFMAKSTLTSLLLTTLAACGNSTVKAPQTPNATPTPPTIESRTKATTTEGDALLAQGQKVFRKCRTCHTVNDGGRHRVGPNLYGVIESQIASKDGFAYSKAFKASDITWTDKNLDAFLAKPRDFIPKNRMTFVGLKKDEDRKAVIAYLHSVTK